MTTNAVGPRTFVYHTTIDATSAGGSANADLTMRYTFEAAATGTPFGPFASAYSLTGGSLTVAGQTVDFSTGQISVFNDAGSFIEDSYDVRFTGGTLFGHSIELMRFLLVDQQHTMFSDTTLPGASSFSTLADYQQTSIQFVDPNVRSLTVSEFRETPNAERRPFTLTEITEVNATPQASPGNLLSTRAGSAVNASVGAVDPDGDTLTYALKSGAGPQHGAVGFDAANPDHYTYTPDAGFIGSDSFTVNVDDGHSHTIEQAVRVAVNPPNGALLDIGPAYPGEVRSMDDFDVVTALSLPTAGASTSTQHVTTPYAGDFIVFRGSGFTYDAGGHLNGGAITSINEVDAGLRVATVTGFNLAVPLTTNAAALQTAFAGDDLMLASADPALLRGYAGADTEVGGAGDDSLFGDAGNDSLLGAGGGDNLSGGGGDDALDGGAGSDTAHFSDVRSHYIVTTLQNGDLRVEHANGGADGTDVVRNVEVFDFSGQALSVADLMLASSPALSIAPTDSIKAEGNSGSTPFTFTVTRSGDLSFAMTASWAVTGSGGDPAAANDFQGGVLPSGQLLFVAGEASKLVTVNVAGETLVEASENFTVTLSNPSPSATISQATAVGTISNDDVGAISVITGDEGPNTLTGTVGDDTISGLGGADQLSGGDGADSLDGGQGNDQLDGGLGADTLVGGEGNDALRDDYGANSFQGGGGADFIGMYSSEVQYADGGDGDDYLDFQSNSPQGTLIGGQGNDTLYSRGVSHLSVDGGPDNDLIYLFQVSHATIDAGSGADTLNAQQVSELIYDAGDGKDYIGASYAISSATLHGGLDDDTIYVGDNTSNIAAFGDDGADTISAAGAGITISGGAGVDRFALLKPGSFTVTDFSVGDEVLDISGVLPSLSGYSGGNPFGSGYLRLVQNGADTLLQWDSNGAAGGQNFATLATLQGVTATQLTAANLGGYDPTGAASLGSVITGDEGPNTLTGTVGDDTISGLGGADQLSGGDGADSLDGGQGNDQLDGGLGADTLVGGEGNDALRDDYGANSFQGGGGADFIGMYSSEVQYADGGDGDDYLDFQSNSPQGTLIGGQGNDTLYSRGVSHLSVDGGPDNDLIYLFQVSHATIDAGSGADTLNAQQVSELIYDAGDGKDYIGASYAISSATLHGGLDDDTIYVGDNTSNIAAFGDDGADTISAAGAGITISGGAGVDRFALLKPGSFTVTDFSVGDEVLDISGVLPSLSGYSGGNPFGSGYLRLVQNGADTLLQWDSNGAAGGQNFATLATLQGVTATQLTAANLGGYDPSGAASLGSVITGDEGPNTLTGTVGDDTISGLGGADQLSGGDGADSLDGGQGNDQLDGGLGADTLVGGEGNDALRDDYGANSFQGGGGADFIGMYSSEVQYADGGDGDDYLDFQSNSPQGTLIGGQGNDTLYSRGVSHLSVDGGPDNDLIYLFQVSHATIDAGSGADTLNAQQVSELIYDAGDGKDYIGASYAISSATLHGGLDDDTIYVGDNTSNIAAFGDDGADTISAAGAGITISGGAGVDRFALLKPGSFTVTDFSVGDEVLDISGVLPSLSGYSGGNPFGSGYLRLVQNGADTLLQWDSNGPTGGASFATLATLQGVTATQLTAVNLGGYDPVVAAPASTLAVVATDAVKDEGAIGQTPFTFTVTRSGDTSIAATVDYAVSGAGSDAASSADFGGALPSGALIFAVGQTSRLLTVNVAGDTLFEPNEGFRVTLSNASGGGATIQTASAIGTITNDDLAPTLAIAATDAVKNEGNSGDTEFSFTVTRSGDTSLATNVDFAVTGSGASAASAADFGGALPAGTVNFLSGEVSKNIVIRVSGDTTFEQNEDFTVTLSNASGDAAIQQASAAGSIINDDGAPSLAISPPTMTQTEGNSGSIAYAYTVSRLGDVSGATTVDWSVAGSGASAASAADFVGGVLPGGTVSFAAGETSKSVTVNVAGDALIEPDEGFTVTLVNASGGAAVTTATAAGVITNDDAGQSLSISPNLVAHAEGASGSTAYVFTVTRSGGTAGVATASWAVTGSGANPVSAADFASGIVPSGTISFAAGQTSRTITINVRGDTGLEPDEGFTVTLSNPSAGVAIGIATAEGVVTNDDAPPPIAPSAPDLMATSDTGESSSDDLTNDATPTFTGTALAGSTVRLLEGTKLLGQAPADSGGSWTITASTLSSGSHLISATSTMGGAVSAPSAITTLVIDRVLPTRPSIPDLALADDTGRSQSDNVTSDATPLIEGTAQPGALVTLFDGTAVLGSSVADPTGAWSVTTGVLTDGVHKLTAKAEDAAGNLSSASGALTLTVDTVTVAPTFTSATTAKLTGTAEAGAIVSVFDGATQIGQATATSAGVWTLSKSQSNTPHTISVTAVDKAGVSAAGTGQVLFGDSTANSLIGGAGDDRIIGLAGADTVAGGAGADVFVFGAGFGKEVITDFEAGPSGGDRIEITKASLGVSSSSSAQAAYDALLAKTAELGADAVITLDAANAITLTGVMKSSLDSGDFIFV